MNIMGGDSRIHKRNEEKDTFPNCGLQVASDI